MLQLFLLKQSSKVVVEDDEDARETPASLVKGYLRRLLPHISRKDKQLREAIDVCLLLFRNFVYISLRRT